MDPTKHGDWWADVYDDAHRHLDDVQNIVKFIDRRLMPDATHPLIEFGAGTGRVTIPLAEAGYSILAVDTSAGMLDKLRVKNPSGSIRTLVVDARSLDTPASGVVMFFNFLYAFADAEAQAAVIDAAVRCAAPARGPVVVELDLPRLPSPGDYKSGVAVREVTDDSVTLHAYKFGLANEFLESMRITLRRDGTDLRPTRQQFISLAAMDAEFARNGYVPVERHNSWDESAAGDGSHVISVFRPETL
jgi:SAM-dependent methyltransferase